MRHLLDIPGRAIFWLEDSSPAVYLLRDKQAGNVLINTTPFDQKKFDQIEQLGGINYIFLPSHRGAFDLPRWQDASQANVLAHANEASLIDQQVDIPLDRSYKLSRTIEFLPMSGRTPGCCAMFLKNQPGVIFFGPALEPDAGGWPTLLQHDDDYSFENRLIGALALKDLRFNYAFTDTFVPGHTQFGPDADKHIQHALDKIFGASA